MKDMDTVSELIDVPSPRRNLRKRMIRQGSVSENYIAIQDAAIILPRQSTLAPVDLIEVKSLSHIQSHLHAIFNCLREQDSVKLAARLESWDEVHIRYLVIVSTLGRQDTEESIIIGMDFETYESTTCTIGLVLPIWRDTLITLDGDGGFKITSNESTVSTIIFKPVSVQAMWSSLQCLHKCVDIASKYNYFQGSLYLTWISFYQSHTTSDRLYMNEWEFIEHLYERRPNYFSKVPTDRASVELMIRNKLKKVMLEMDLDNSTSRQIREALEQLIDLDLRDYKEYIDNEMLIILGQMDCASCITDFMYLGSVWNASNLEELSTIGITHILNVTKEVDCFFPESFKYKRISLFDVETADLLPHWNDTWKFIDNCRRNNGKCLVHCKMGISRSSSTVAAFLMKDNLWCRDEALKYVKERRSIICPNPGFMRQLNEYQGIIFASAQRHNKLFRSRSESNLSDTNISHEPSSLQSTLDEAPQYDLHRHLLDITSFRRNYQLSRPKSWSPGDTDLYYNDSIAPGAWSVVSNITDIGDILPTFKPIVGAMKTNDSTQKVKIPRFDRKKWKRRHTEILLVPSHREIVYSEDSVFVNTGESASQKIHETWISNPISSPKKTSRQSSSPAVLVGSQTLSSISDAPETIESEHVVTSPTVESVKKIVARLDSSEPELSVIEQARLNKKTHKKTKSSASIKELNLDSNEGITRERSFSETQAFSVKNIVNKIETKYSTPSPTSESLPPITLVTRSQSMPSARSKSRKTPVMMPVIDDKQSDVSTDENMCDKITNLNDNNNNNYDNEHVFESLEVEKPIKIVEIEQPVRTFTQDELQIIREVGKSFLSHSEEISSDTNVDAIKKHGIVRTMAKEIEKKIRKVVGRSFNQHKNNDHIAHVNKLLMGEVLPDNNPSSVKMKKKHLAKRNNSSPNISSLFGPIPYRSPVKYFQKTVKLHKRHKTDDSLTSTITRSQSERSAVKIPRVLFSNKLKKPTLSTRNSYSESELNDLEQDDDIKDDLHLSNLILSKSEPEIQSELMKSFSTIQVKEMVENIENQRNAQRSLSLTDKHFVNLSSLV